MNSRGRLPGASNAELNLGLSSHKRWTNEWGPDKPLEGSNHIGSDGSPDLGTVPYRMIHTSIWIKSRIKFADTSGHLSDASLVWQTKSPLARPSQQNGEQPKPRKWRK